VSAPAGRIGSTAGAPVRTAGAAAGTAGEGVLPANAIPAPLMSRTATALSAGWRRRAIFIVDSLIVDRTNVRSPAQIAQGLMKRR